MTATTTITVDFKYHVADTFGTDYSAGTGAGADIRTAPRSSATPTRSVSG